MSKHGPASPIDPRVEMQMWLDLFEQRKLELIEGGMTAADADDAACTEIRRRIREEGFREG